MDRNNRVHINGLGDYDIQSATKVGDPCPIELKRTVKEKQEIFQKHAKLGTINKKSLRTLKDKEKVLYAPFSNVGALNFEKATGYITIPDKQVIYTRVADEDEENGISKVKLQKPGSYQEQAAIVGNEGQKMMWFLQDLQQQIDAEQIAAPQLLPGIDLDEAIAEKRKGRRLIDQDGSRLDLDLETTDAFAQHAKSKAQALFRER